MTLGGPIMQDRLWFFTAFRLAASDSFVANMYFPDGEPGRTAATSRRAARDAPADGAADSQNNKLRGAYYNSNSSTQRYDVGCTATSGNRVSCVAPEAAYALPMPMQQSADVKWTSTRHQPSARRSRRSRSASRRYRFDYQPENGPFDVMNRNNSTGWRTVASATAESDYLSTVWNTLGSVSYVTGSHTFKAGMNHEWGDSQEPPGQPRARCRMLTFEQRAACRGELGRPCATRPATRSTS